LLVAFLLLVVLVLLAGLFSEAMLGQRTKWAAVVGRFLLPGLGALVALAATVGWWPVLAAALLVNLPFTIPLGWSWADLEAMMRLALPLLLAAGLSLELWRWFGRRRRPLVAAVLAACVLALTGGLWLERVRGDSRHRIYRAAAGRTIAGQVSAAAFDVHPLKPEYAVARVIWERLDRGHAHRLAVTVGRTRLGHNGYLYPLLGRRLQNQLLYVTPTRDGSRLASNQPHLADAARLDPEAWINRLARLGVDHVVALPPEPPELAWMLARPRQFTPVPGAPERGPRLFRFHHRPAASAGAR
jgi:hypothetical protein